MTNTVLLNNVDHADLRVIARQAPEFGDSVNQVVILPTEFEEAQREYPIVFRKDADGALQAVALLGLDRDENLFLDATGWRGRHVPAMLQRGPFLIGFQDGESHREPMIHIDLDHPRVSRADGLALFLPHGGNAPYLEHVAAVLRTIHVGLEATAPMFAAFEEAGLIEPIALEIQVDEGKTYVVPDLFTIGRAALAGLDGERLARLNAAGFLGAAFLVASSLGNVRRLIDLKTARTAADRPVPAAG